MSDQEQRIVVRSTNWLGDAVMSTSALQRLREARPSASITILTHEKLADLWTHQPYVDDVIAFTDQENPFQIGRRLRWGNFDLGILFPNSPRSALEMWWGKVGERVGYRRPWRNMFLTRIVETRADELPMKKRSGREIRKAVRDGAAMRYRFPTAAHHVHHYLNLMAEAVGSDRSPLPPRLVVPDAELGAIRAKFLNSTSEGPVFGLNPGAEYGAAKRWPVENFVEAAQRLRRITKCTWLIFGGLRDSDLAARIAMSLESSEGNVVNLAGRTKLSELCALMKLCSIVLTNDTGPMHLAAAVGTPVIVPFGSTSPELTGPGLPGSSRHRLLAGESPCAPCFLRDCPIDLRCLRSVTVDQVVNAALMAGEQALNRTPK